MMRWVVVILWLVTASCLETQLPGTVTMFSDAQCPCSAQFVADIEHLLKSATLRNGNVDFHQYFVPACMDAVDHCEVAKDPEYYTKCIHGDEECLGRDAVNS
jgi:hypothetical protein